MEQPPVRPGTVEWTGDNPFIYLKTDLDRDWSSLSLFFRITASRHGVGHAMLILERPFEPAAGAARLLFCDNEPLATFLRDEFFARFALFRPFDGWEGVDTLAGAWFESAPGERDWTERARSADGARTASMTWTGLSDPFAVDLPPKLSSTGEHEMFSVFRTAASGSVTVDGRTLDGGTVERDFLNGRSQSAALALSETWIAP